ncbi:unnamed protein product [Lepeophtheirus salmonis]|uniref:(salmon louse) hypothetical protein n=1 Tax=Lepeophtheirus salmonis TaxID=72036 RepID=A0A7R8H148_LEPSM|nr:unnamed protein product [Lepeophtheirus salmonis]CAF2804496.1 unnamed protein product [Lepeophtheirus salmonis]
MEGKPANLPAYAPLDNNIFTMEYPNETRQCSNCFHFGQIKRECNNCKMSTKYYKGWFGLRMRRQKKDGSKLLLAEDSEAINVGENMLEGNSFDISKNDGTREDIVASEDEDSGEINNSEKIKESEVMAVEKKGDLVQRV